MSALATARMYGRFAVGLHGFLRRRVTLEEARQTIGTRLEERERRFLRIVERGVFGNPGSPYLPLLRQAGCDLSDLRTSVRDRGLEGTLQDLLDAGVYVHFDEFKGRAPLERGGVCRQFSARDFDNPYIARHYEVETGGSTGAGTRITHDLDHLTATAPNQLLLEDAWGIVGAPKALWRGVLPVGAGVNQVLRSVVVGNPIRRWFSPLTREDIRPPLKYRLATAYVVEMSRLLGASVPRPEPVRLDRADVVARWALEAAREDGRAEVRTSPSMAVRVALAAREADLDLTGVVFVGGGEPPTEAKVRQITGTGARYVPTYAMSEMGGVGAGCARPIEPNDCHLLSDCAAIVPREREVPGGGTVQAFCITSLLPTAPKLMLNVEVDDYGVLEERSCGCPLERAGYTTHVRSIQSYKKLTGEGMTLVGSDMVRILEEVLPDRFGGSPLDYQLVEEEDGDGFTRLTLSVAPEVPIPDDGEVVAAILEALGRSGDSADVARVIWGQAESFRVRRSRPVLTAAGKHLPLRKVGR